MATLNLIPDPVVLGAQVAVFLANLVVVKTLFVAPYMAVRERREALTVGSKDQAAKALADADSISKKIESRLLQTALEVKASREQARVAIQGRVHATLASAEAEAKKAVAAVEQQIRLDLTEEKTKIPSIVKALTEDVYKLALA